MAAANPPKDPSQRRRRNKPARGEWKATPGFGWQHGPIPDPPDGVLEVTRDAWMTWFRAWFASHWGPEDLPGLVQAAKAFDDVLRGQAGAAGRAELRAWMDGYGITPKGQQDRRWMRPPEPAETSSRRKAPASPYGHLRVVGKS